MTDVEELAATSRALTGGSSDRQWRDIVGVLRAAELDDAYLDRTADQTGFGSRLADARRDARGS